MRCLLRHQGVQAHDARRQRVQLARNCARVLRCQAVQRGLRSRQALVHRHHGRSQGGLPHAARRVTPLGRCCITLIFCPAPCWVWPALHSALVVWGAPGSVSGRTLASRPWLACVAAPAAGAEPSTASAGISAVMLALAPALAAWADPEAAPAGSAAEDMLPAASTFSPLIIGAAPGALTSGTATGSRLASERMPLLAFIAATSAARASSACQTGCSRASNWSGPWLPTALCKGSISGRPLCSQVQHTLQECRIGCSRGSELLWHELQALHGAAHVIPALRGGGKEAVCAGFSARVALIARSGSI